MRIRARSMSGSMHIVTGTVEGGVHGKTPGWSVPWRSLEQAKEHLARNNWEFIEVLP